MAEGPEAGARMGSLLIVGSGALAVLFAARLAASGAQVELLGTWTDGLAALNREGARLEGEGGFPVRALPAPGDCSPARAALVLVKSWQTERAARQLSQCLLPDGLALSLQNGLGNGDRLAQVLGAGRVACGVTTLGATLLAPGLARSAGEGQVIVERDPRLARLVAQLRQAGFQVAEMADTRSLVWGKLIVSSAINPLTALLRVRNGELLERPAALALLHDLAREAAAVARAQAVQLAFSDPVQAVEQVARQTAGNLSSMLQDVLRGSPTEVDAINGAIVALAETCGVATPVNRAIYKLVKALIP